MNIPSINASIQPADLAEILQISETLESKLPFLISLTPLQRRDCLKMGDKSVSFVEKVMAYSTSNSNLVPVYLDTAKFARDLQLSRDLMEVRRRINPFVQNVEDSAMAVGVEVLAAAMVFYNSVKTAARNGVPGAKSIYEDLQKRFPGAGKQSAQAPPAV